MNTDTRLAVGAHILALLSFAPPGRACTSELLAKSVNTNAVVIRRLLGRLKDAGLVNSRVGGGGSGGSILAMPPETISLLDVYKAVVPKSNVCPFRLHETPNSLCFVGENIHDALEMPLAKVRQAVQDSLGTTTIADIAAFIRARRETGRNIR